MADERVLPDVPNPGQPASADVLQLLSERERGEGETGVADVREPAPR